jgi:hypothetical protein
MKSILSLVLSGFVLLAAGNTSQAWWKVVQVYCDVNGNGHIDSADTPLSGVGITVTNLSGTYVTNFTTGPDGTFIVKLLNDPDTYVDFVSGAPAGTTAVLPAFNTFSTTPDNIWITNSFLIENPNCVVPPPTQADCWMTGGGTTGTIGSPPIHSFGGVVFPGCKATAAGGGNWNDVDHVNKLHFKGLDIVHVACGNLPGYPPGSSSPKTPFNFIDFAGTGTLKGIGGNTANFGTVFFTARAVDLGEPGKGVDQYYLRVYDASGTTLLLVSATPSDPTAISPVTLRSGNIQLHISGCDKPGR